MKFSNETLHIVQQNVIWLPGDNCALTIDNIYSLWMKRKTCETNMLTKRQSNHIKRHKTLKNVFEHKTRGVRTMLNNYINSH